MLRFVNVATPFTALTVVVPERVAPAAPVPGVMDSVTGAEEEVTVLPRVSWIATTGWVVNTSPATAPTG